MPTASRSRSVRFLHTKPEPTTQKKPFSQTFWLSSLTGFLFFFGLIHWLHHVTWIGTVLLVIPLPTSAKIAEIIWLAGGAGTLVLGIVAVANDSKIGIGGIIIGAALILIGIPGLF